MAELQILVSKRKALRIRVSACSNRQANYENFTEIQRNAEKIKILEIKKELCKLDETIQDRKFGDAEEFEEKDIDIETAACSEYHEKIRLSITSG